MWRKALIWGAALALAACSNAPAPKPQFHAEDNPQALSEWGVIGVHGGELVLGDDVVPYTLASPLFTDYAHKLRTIWVPEGEQIFHSAENEILKFPVGTVISKTFYYPKAEGGVARTDDLQPVNASAGLDLSTHRVIETRLLVHRDAGWEAVSYVWNEEQTEAKLTRIGAVFDMTLVDGSTRTDFTYAVPNQNQCAGCHMPNAVDKVMQPLGPRPFFLNTTYDYGDRVMNQLDKLEAMGMETIFVSSVRKLEADADIETRARAYLDMNCAHCHNERGPASTSGLHLNLENQSLPHLGLCKPPIAAGGGTGGHSYSIEPGAPEQSIFAYRMNSRDPGAMMPELGRSLTHSEGVALVEQWIAQMEGSCAG